MTQCLYSMPIIVLNMGSEMTYILAQRLSAQKISNDKAKQVLQDVLLALFSNVFIEELFKPQEIYSVNSTKQIFEKIAHSSIMRLNKNSMDKLFDLMIMTFKYQILFSNSPQQYLQVTLNHLESLRYMMINYSSSPEMVTGPFKSQVPSPNSNKQIPSPVIGLIDDVISRFIRLYGNFSSLQFLSLKQSLYLYFQGKKIKISIFLQQNIQDMNGNFIFVKNSKLPYGTENPGQIKLYDHNRCTTTDTFVSEIGNDYDDNHNEILDKSSSLGFNLFDNTVKPPPIIFESSLELEKLMASNQESKLSSSNIKQNEHIPRKTVMSSSKAEINGLADILGLGIRSSSSKEIESKDSFKINLFPTNTFDSKRGSKGIDDFDDYEDNDSGFIHIDIDATSDFKTVDKYMKDLNLDDYNNDNKAEGKDNDDDDDDLLDLMDSIK